MDKTFLDIFKKCVNRNPEQKALITESQELTYLQLDEMSDMGAGFLKEHGFKRGDKVVLVASPTNTLIPAILSCLKAGVCFLPLAADSPQSYISSVATLFQCNSLFAEDDNQILPNMRCYKFQDLFASSPGHLPTIDTSGVAYSILTSGSTGLPKLAFRRHAALVSVFEKLREGAPQFFRYKRTMICASLNFAFGLDQTLFLLASGTTLYLGDCYSTKHLFSKLEMEKIEQVLLPISYIKLFSRNPQLMRQIPENVRSIVSGGEPMSVSADFVFFCRERGITIFNNYGSSETATLCMCQMNIDLADIENINHVLLKKCLPGYDFLILDKNMRECSSGDLYVITDNFYGLTKMDDHDLGDFLFLPQFPNKILYKTCDIAEKSEYGIKILGRINNSVNIRGCKICFEDLERVIGGLLPEIECCVSAKPNQYGEATLVCFYANSDLTEQQLHSKLFAALPSFMIPTDYVLVKKLPRLPNGKINRVLLGQLLEESPVQKISAATSLQAKLKNILERMLLKKMPGNYATMSFRYLGLDSLAVLDFICLVESEENLPIEDSLLKDGSIRNIEELVNYIMRIKQ